MNNIISLLKFSLLTLIMFVGTHADAATLKLNPSTGVYAV